MSDALAFREETFFDLPTSLGVTRPLRGPLSGRLLLHDYMKEGSRTSLAALSDGTHTQPRGQPRAVIHR
jgi:hypothetical protein